MRYYLNPAFDNNPSKDKPMLLKLDENINSPNFWKTISEKEYLKLLQNGYKSEYIQKIKKDFIIKYAYEYYYTKWIHYLINEGKCKYFWFKPNEQIFLFHDTFSFNRPNETNKFILSSINNETKLGNDILNNGLYFPFIFNKTPEPKKLKVHLGFHRIYSLSLLKTEKEFLGIFFPFSSEQDFIKKVNSNNDVFLNKNIPYYILNAKNNEILFGHSDNLTNLNYFFTFSDDLAPLLYDYKNEIKPNIIWNNKDIFEEWINKPFEINKGLEI